MAKKRTRATDRERALSAEIQATRNLAENCEIEGKYGDAVRARTLVARLESDYHRIRGARLCGAEQDEIRRTELMRDLAEQEGSWVAAGKMAATVRELRAKLAEETGGAELTPAQMRAHHQKMAASLPDSLLHIYIAEFLESHQELHLASADGPIEIHRSTG